MEQKKTLWIIAAVGVFLLVVLGVPAILHYPSRNPVPAYASISPVEKINPSSGWTKPSADISAPASVTAQDVSAAKVSDLVVLADNATVYSQNTSSNGATTIDLNSLKNELINEAQNPAQPQNINITVNIPEGKTTETKTVITPYTEQLAAKPVESPAKSNVTSNASSNVVKTVQKSETKAVKPAKTTSAPAAAPAKVEKAEAKKTQFWVQVAAYSNKKGAEGARSVLDANKIPSDIFTYRDNKDKLYYRVRVGPYTTKSEAEYWRTKIVKIKEIDNANDSYITSTVN